MKELEFMFELELAKMVYEGIIDKKKRKQTIAKFSNNESRFSMKSKLGMSTMQRSKSVKQSNGEYEFFKLLYLSIMNNNPPYLLEALVDLDPDQLYS